MANTYTLIASNTLGSNTGTVTFSSIPNTYTDLILKVSIRASIAQVNALLRIYFNGNGSSSLFSNRNLTGNGSTASSASDSSLWGSDVIIVNGASATASTYGNAEVYIPSYTVAQNKPISGFGAGENNATTGYLGVAAGLWRSTSAITSISITNAFGGNMLSGSSFFLYGIKNS